MIVCFGTTPKDNLNTPLLFHPVDKILQKNWKKGINDR
jgi:hypothetical protein